jgi:hypothetical protein
MKDKEVNYGFTFNEKTFFVLRQMKDGMLLSFPQELPNYHFSFLIKKEGISIHPTDESKDGKNRYHNKNRVEIEFNDIHIENLEKDLENIIKKYEFPISKLPGSLYLGGYFQLSENETNAGKSRKCRIPLEEYWKQLYIIRRNKMTFCKDKIWIALNRDGGIKGKWYDIGIVFGPFKDRVFFFPYKAFRETYSYLYPNLSKMDMSFMYSEINMLPPFDEKAKKFLMGKGRKVVKETYK